jgi:hypothetical protein
MALGADRGSVLGMVIRSGLKLVGAGIAIGLAVALLLGRVMGSQPWGVSSYDPPTIRRRAGAAGVDRRTGLLETRPARYHGGPGGLLEV